MRIRIVQTVKMSVEMSKFVNKLVTQKFTFALWSS